MAYEEPYMDVSHLKRNKVVCASNVDDEILDSEFEGDDSEGWD